MKNNAFVLMLLALLIGSTAFGQTRTCHTTEHLDYQRQIDPKVDSRMERIEQHTQNFIANGQASKVNAVITIPIVFHIVYRTSTENISESQIMSQLQVLNDDFRRTNSDADGTWSQAADTEIEFCLATVDPNGNPTTGITRTSTTVNGFGTNDAMKYSSQGGKDAWDRNKYLNFWVCNIGGGILGYAQFPGGSAATDGVVCGYQYVGTEGTATAPFDLGRTATHEVGHWANLRHIWGDGGCSVDDFVLDTPESDGANYGCATGHTSCSTVDMVQNYMDYSDDGCMNLYTAGQTARMQAVFAPGGSRSALANSTACGAAPDPTCTDGVQNGSETGVDCGGPDCADCPTCFDGVMNGTETGVDCGGDTCVPCPCTGNVVDLQIVLDQYGSETTWEVLDGGTTVASGGPYSDGTDGLVVSESFCLADGCYDFVINDAYGDGICCGYGNGSYNLSDANGVLASGGQFASSETTNFCLNNTPTPTCNDGVLNGNETDVDCGGPDCPACPTCDDGVQNGKETGVDCGGPDCMACATCSDGMENGNETGVDCGGPDCAACITCDDGIMNGDETGVDCGGPDCAPCTTCNDGVMNGGETGVDCGGDCPNACATCSDGMQNGDETGVDCGGSDCAPCATCDDGAMNGDETGVDCGGSDCPACATCNDGVMNGDETGIDCGGSCPNACTGCTDVTIDSNNFDSSWGIWNDGGSDCRRSAQDAQYSNGGTGRSVRLRDNTASSTTTTDLLDLSSVSELTVDFNFYARSMENNEDFWLQISTDGGASYTTVASWASGTDFSNNVGYDESVVIAGPFTSNSRVRFRCDASGNSDYVYIDDVVISGCSSSNKTDFLNGSTPVVNSISLGRDVGADREQITGMSLFPNPTTDNLNVAFNIADVADVQLSVISITGQVVSRQQLNELTGEQLVKVDASQLTPGYYFIQLVTENEIKSNKFVIVR